MTEEQVADELHQAMRMTITAAGQVGERLARYHAEQARSEQHQLDVQRRDAHQTSRDAEQAQQRTQADHDRRAEAARREQQRRAEQAQRDEQRRYERSVEQARRDAVAAGRSVYGPAEFGRLRQPDWPENGKDAARVGAMYDAANLMADTDPVARTARDRILTEARNRYGDAADRWLANAVWAYQQAARETADLQAAVDEQLRQEGRHDQSQETDAGTTAEAEAAANLAHEADLEQDVHATAREACQVEGEEAAERGDNAAQHRDNARIRKNGFPNDAAQDLSNGRRRGPRTPRRPASDRSVQRSRDHRRGR